MSEVNNTTSASTTPAPETASAQKQWYIIHTQTGQEMKVKSALEGKIQQGLAGNQIGTVLVPKIGRAHV